MRLRIDVAGTCISGSGTVSDELAETVQVLGEELKPIAGMSVGVGVSDARPAADPPAESWRVMADTTGTA